jgi:aryl-alcohol dehydrogenase-like predicted oxidoreductase
MKYNQLGRTGVLVSEICLGTMTFGGKGFWKSIGEVPQDQANQILKDSIDAGINFIDTANVYSEGLSEKMVGTGIKDLGLPRQSLFIATKVRGRVGPHANQVGLSKLHIADSVNDSLARMGLDHIDLLYIHGVDKLTPIEDTMRGLEDVIRSGKVRYIGVSNHGAWMMMKANGYADKMGYDKFVATQNYYSIASRDIEREIVPMSLSEGISIIPWSPLAGGFLSGKFTRDNAVAGDSRRDSFDFPPINKEKAYEIIDLMGAIGLKQNVSTAQVALAWVLCQPGITSVIIGAKNSIQLKDNISATKLILSAEDINALNTISELPKEYPQWMVDFQSQGRIPE